MVVPWDTTLAERLAAEREAELRALQKENEQLKSERTHYCQRVVLLEEELRWMKAQYFGTSSQKTDAPAVNPDQAKLFTRPRSRPRSRPPSKPSVSAPRRLTHTSANTPAGFE